MCNASLGLIEEYYEQGMIQGIEKGKLLGIEEGKIQGIEKGKIQGIEEGKLLGIEEGKMQGIEEGMIQGIEKGKIQGIASEKAKQEAIMFQTILNLHNINISIKDIASCTNRSIEEVQAIIDENNN